jgi:hypothetical protein
LSRFLTFSEGKEAIEIRKFTRGVVGGSHFSDSLEVGYEAD